MRQASASGPPQLRRPPATLPPLHPLLWSDTLWRIADDPVLRFRTHSQPRFRFDAPSGEYPSLYTCALDVGTFAEAFADRGRRLGRHEGQRFLLELRPRAPLPLIDFHDTNVLVMLDLDERISVGDDYEACQSWALAIHQQLPDVLGIRYRARKAGALVANVVLFVDRCSHQLDVINARRLEEIEDLVLHAADRYRLTVFFPFNPRH